MLGMKMVDAVMAVLFKKVTVCTHRNAVFFS
jgi:hypothetical protein